MTDPFAALDRLIATAGPTERPVLIAALASRIALLAAADMTATDEPSWLTVDDASEIALVPRRRIRQWARRTDATWASRPTKRTLLIARQAFMAWISTTAPPRAPTCTRRSLEAPPDPSNSHLQVATGPETA